MKTCSKCGKTLRSHCKHTTCSKCRYPRNTKPVARVTAPAPAKPKPDTAARFKAVAEVLGLDPQEITEQLMASWLGELKNHIRIDL